MNYAGDAPPTPEQESFKLTAEIGKTGLRRFGGYMQEEFDPDLRGQRGMRRFDEMRRNDPDVGAILTAIEMSMLSVEWSVERAGETPADEDAAQFLESCLEDMSLSWRDFLADVFTLFPFGFALHEIVYKMRTGPKPHSNDPNDPAPSRFDDGRIGWRKIAIRHQETIERWSFDEKGGIRGAWQQQPMGGRVFLPIDKCVLFTTKRERGNPEGYSILRNAWMSYYIKTNIQEIEVIGAERDLTGIPVMRLPVGASAQDKNAALEILEKLKWDDQAGLVLPRTGNEAHQWWEFELVSSPGAPRMDTDKIITRSSTAIARSVLAQFLTLGQGRVGSYALSKDMRDLFHLAVKGWFDRIEETINRFMVDRLFSLNDFGEISGTPKLRHGRMGQRQIDTFVSAISQLATLGMPITKDDWNMIRGELEMPLLPDDVEIDDPDSNPAPVEDEDGEDTDPDESSTTGEKWFSKDYR